MKTQDFGLDNTVNMKQLLTVRNLRLATESKSKRKISVVDLVKTYF